MLGSDVNQTGIIIFSLSPALFSYVAKFIPRTYGSHKVVMDHLMDSVFLSM